MSLARLGVAVLLLPALMGAQQAHGALKVGDVLPALAGQTPGGKQVDLAAALGKGPAVVVFSFSREGGRDAQRWTERLGKDDPQLAEGMAIFLESVPGLFRGMAVSGIRSGVPAALQERTVLIFRDEGLWKERLQVANDRYAGVVLVGADGRIRWMGKGPFADAMYSELNASIRGLR